MGLEHRSDSQQMDDSNDPKAPPVRRKFIGQPKPVPFNVDDTAEVYRLLCEVHGYLRTCQGKHGTDFQGRQYAMDALDELQKRDWKLVPDPPK